MNGKDGTTVISGGYTCPYCDRKVKWELPHVCPDRYEGDMSQLPVMLRGDIEFQELHNPYLSRIANALERIADKLEKMRS